LLANIETKPGTCHSETFISQECEELVNSFQQNCYCDGFPRPNLFVTKM